MKRCFATAAAALIALMLARAQPAYAEPETQLPEFTITNTTPLEPVYYGDSETTLAVSVLVDGCEPIIKGYNALYSWVRLRDDGQSEEALDSNSNFVTVGSELGAGTYSYLCRVELMIGNTPVKRLESELFTLNILPKEVDVPEKDTRAFTYNGKDQTYTVASSELYTVRENVERDAGAYEVTVALNDKRNYCWRGGCADDLVYEFVIEKAHLTLSLPYTLIEINYGDALTLPDASVEPFTDVFPEREEVELDDVGDHTVLYFVSESTNYHRAEITLTVRVNPLTRDMSGVSMSDKTVVADGTLHSIFVTGELPDGVTVRYRGNGVSEPGVYTVVASFDAGRGYLPIPDMQATLTVTAPVIPEPPPSGDGNNDAPVGGGTETDTPGTDPEGGGDTGDFGNGDTPPAGGGAGGTTSGGTGSPDGTGTPDGTGSPGGAGSSGDTGSPEGTGSSGDTGSPDTDVGSLEDTDNDIDSNTVLIIVISASSALLLGGGAALAIILIKRRGTGRIFVSHGVKEALSIMPSAERSKPRMQNSRNTPSSKPRQQSSKPRTKNNEVSSQSSKPTSRSSKSRMQNSRKTK